MNAPRILGIGTDIIELGRIRVALTEHDKFLSRLFSAEEQAFFSQYKDPIPHIAGHFAAKEALAKALGTGFGKELSWLDLTISHDALGKPQVTYSKSLATKMEHSTLHVSISHCELYAVAFAVWEK